MKESSFYRTLMPLLVLLFTCCAQQAHSQDNDPCDMDLTSTLTEVGDISICYESSLWLRDVVVSCTSEAGYLINDEGGRSSCMTVPCCSSSSAESPTLVITYSGLDNRPCWNAIYTSCCMGPDTDGDGVCDEEDCWPDDSSQGHRIGGSCDDGDANTHGDHYDDNCVCVGWPGQGCLTDYDGDGICDDEDCNPQDANLAHSTGDLCNDGDSTTYNDRYDENCNCLGEPLPCGLVDPDDGCLLTTDGIDGDCNIINTPPDPDDGCPLTYDYFDAVNCVIVNEVPDVDDGCAGTLDVYNPHTCEIIHELMPCNDGDATTVGDKYNDNCVCQGCDPCQMQGEKWTLLCELQNR